MKVSQEKFHTALDTALAIIIAKREAGYANDLEKYAGNVAEMALSKIYSVDDYFLCSADVRGLIGSILHFHGKNQEFGLLNCLENSPEVK